MEFKAHSYLGARPPEYWREQVQDFGMHALPQTLLSVLHDSEREARKGDVSLTKVVIAKGIRGRYLILNVGISQRKIRCD